MTTAISQPVATSAFPFVTGNGIVDGFFSLLEAGIRGEQQLRPEDWRDEILRRLDIVKPILRTHAASDRVVANAEQIGQQFRSEVAQKLGSVRQALKIAHETASHAQSHDLLPENWLQSRLSDVADIIDKSQVALAELHESAIATNPARAPVSRSSGGQDGAGDIPF